MSIEVRVPEEIEDYKESIVAGLSVRQLVCSGIALLCGIPTFLLLKNINADLATYSTMIVVVPAFCVGFIKKDGYNFETYLKIRLYNLLSKSQRGYESNPDENVLPIEVEEYRRIIQGMQKEELKHKSVNDNTVITKKGGEKLVLFKKKSKSRAKATAKYEYDLAEISAKSIKRKRKAAYKSIKAAEGYHREKKQKEEKTA